MLFFTVLVVLELALLAAVLVSKLIDGTWDFSGLTTGSGLVVITLGMLLSERGRQHNGRVSPLWMVIVIVISVAALVVAGIQVLNDYRDVAKVVVATVMAAAVVTTSVYVISNNRNGRLGLDRQPRRKP